MPEPETRGSTYVGEPVQSRLSPHLSFLMIKEMVVVGEGTSL